MIIFMIKVYIDYPFLKHANMIFLKEHTHFFGVHPKHGPIILSILDVPNKEDNLIYAIIRSAKVYFIFFYNKYI